MNPFDLIEDGVGLEDLWGPFQLYVSTFYETSSVAASSVFLVFPSPFPAQSSPEFPPLGGFATTSGGEQLRKGCLNQ